MKDVEVERNIKFRYPVIPLRDIVAFPKMILPLFVGRKKSIAALDSVIRDDKKVVLITQKDGDKDEPKCNDLHNVGVIASIVQLLKLPDETVKVVVEIENRVQVKHLNDEGDFLHADVSLVLEDYNKDLLKLLHKTVVNKFEDYALKNNKITKDSLNKISLESDVSVFCDLVAPQLNAKSNIKQEMLSEFDINKRLELIYTQMELEIELLDVEDKLRESVKKSMEKNQREYFLNEQMKAIQKEMDGGEDNDYLDYDKKIKKSKMPKEIKKKCFAELKKVKNSPPMSADGAVIRTYLDTLIEMPWKKYSKTNSDIKKAKDILNEDHYGLDKVKERILEHIAVNIRMNNNKSPILCFVGPPGVGKTSLVKSIARACNRKFVKMSLGGVRDESEIRGHRKTYIGSMPGRIIQGIKKAEVSNPVFLLDEIDKLGSDYRGDPSSALLEVLDPSQNTQFNDHYLDVDYDLSNVMFVTTANTLDMPLALRDRLEIIDVSGYSENEKIKIAKNYLLPKIVKENNFSKKEFIVSDGAILDVVRYYTKESGVRGLERNLNALSRKAVTKIMYDNVSSFNVEANNLEEFLGVRKYKIGLAEKEDKIGLVTGLAWTSVGGELLHVESVLSPGKGKVKKTGKLGSVMQESITAAETYIKSNSKMLGIDYSKFSSSDIHVHVPEGAIPKDGPSAGVTMVTAIVSSLLDNPVIKDVAMTGEVTLHGSVLPIGGLKEKLLAANRGGIKTVLIPSDNEKDLKDIPSEIKDGLTIISVTNVKEVLDIALVKKISKTKDVNDTSSYVVYDSISGKAKDLHK